MHSIGANKRIIKSQSCFHSFGNGLLSNIKVAEPSDFFGFIQYITADFHFPHDVELSIMLENFISCDANFGGDNVGLKFKNFDERLDYGQCTSLILAEAENENMEVQARRIIIWDYIMLTINVSYNQQHYITYFPPG